MSLDNEQERNEQELEAFWSQRRGFVRVKVDIPIILTTHYAGKQYIEKTASLDISAGGMRLGCKVPIALGEDATVELLLSSTQSIILEATVLRCRLPEIPGLHAHPYEIGISYRPLDHATETQLVRFVFQQELTRRKGRM